MAGMNEHVQQWQQQILQQVRVYAAAATSPLNSNSWPLATNTIDADELAAAVEVLLSGKFTMGVRTHTFEQAWSHYLGAAGSVMVNSGSSANLLALAALAQPDVSVDNNHEPQASARANDQYQFNPGDEVIVPAVTWSTTIHPIRQAGGVPVLVDVDPHTFNLDPQRVRQALTPRTRGIVIVHLLGNPAHIVELMEIAHRHNLWVVEDCCEAHGARVNGQKVGTFGLLSSFSFFFSHHMTTIEGGMVSVNSRQPAAGSDQQNPADQPLTGTSGADEDLMNRLKSLRAHGWIRERSDRAELARLAGQMDDRWVFVTEGYNVRPTEINAALGLVQLAKLDTYIQQRRQVRQQLRDGLAGFSDILDFQQESANHLHSAFGFGMILKDQAPFDRATFRRHLEQARIETRPIVGGNLARQPVARTANWRIDWPLPVADRIHERGLMIGINPNVSAEQVQYVIDTVGTIVDSSKRRGH
ncbi:MAG: GDP-4-keto-6-deoxy-D-mannose 3-dehydratase [Phycisphaerae bacterium]|nr:GDP-4-keto-6-deoxy-D-mannose 3-dehydratase [Phycisphaerae bacterium]